MPSAVCVPLISGNSTKSALHRVGVVECSKGDSWIMDSCKVLRQHFRCKRSCTVQLGQDIPNSVQHFLATHQPCCTIGNAKYALHTMENMECSEEHFWCVNSCEVLRQHFPCERSCTVEPGRPGRPQCSLTSPRASIRPALLPGSMHDQLRKFLLCRVGNMECSEGDFWFVNSCEVLRQHFPCERGCTVELGQDIPNYVLDRSLATHQTCLIAQKQPACRASHPATARLCPCVKAA